MEKILVEKSGKVFNTETVKRGCLIFAKHKSWPEGKGGFVTAVTEKEITVQYHPGIANVTNHFFIPASEVEDGQWEIRWSADLSEVHTTAEVD